MNRIGVASNVFLIALIVYLLLMQKCQRTEYLKEVENWIDWSEDLYLKLEDQKATNRVMQITNTTLLQEKAHLTAMQKKMIEELEEAKANQVTGASVVVDIKASTSDVHVDTVYVENGQNWPVYSAFFEDEWKCAHVVIGRDQAELELKLPAQLIFTHSEKSLGLFKGSMLEVQGTIDNPYVSFTDLQSLSIKKKPSRLGLGATVGFGTVYSGGVMRAGFGAAIGATWNIQM